MLAITARSTCAVQMLLVAFSRRMCCSPVCSAMRSAGRPAASGDTPMMRPGPSRRWASRVGKSAAFGEAGQPFGPVIHGAHARHHGEEHLRGADVARGRLAPDVLLARLQRHAKRGTAGGIAR